MVGDARNGTAFVGVYCLPARRAFESFGLYPLSESIDQVIWYVSVIINTIMNTFLQELNDTRRRAGLPIKESVTLNVLHHEQETPYMGSQFAQDIEPAGRYYIEKPEGHRKTPNWYESIITFQNPLVINWGTGGYKDTDNWKQVLTRKYKKKGKALSKAILKDGYDGIITIKDGEKSEIVDLRVVNTREQQTNLLSIKGVVNLRPQMVQEIQKLYDEWKSEEDPDDDPYAGGGICQEFAEVIAGVLNEHGYDAGTVSSSVGEQHVWCVVKVAEGVYEVDVPYCIYEIGGGYSWEKIPGVQFSVDDIHIGQLSPNPNEFEQYTEYE